jgi:hypothetical protein
MRFIYLLLLFIYLAHSILRVLHARSVQRLYRYYGSLDFIRFFFVRGSSHFATVRVTYSSAVSEGSHVTRGERTTGSGAHEQMVPIRFGNPRAGHAGAATPNRAAADVKISRRRRRARNSETRVEIREDYFRSDFCFVYAVLA